MQCCLAVQQSQDGSLGLHTDGGLVNCAVLHNHQSGNGHYTELGSQLGLLVSVNISGIKICTSALHKQIDRSLCLIYIDPTVLHRNVHKSEAELLYFIRRIIRHLRNGLPFGILKCTTGCREKRQPVFYQISHCSGELSRFEKSCQAR